MSSQIDGIVLDGCVQSMKRAKIDLSLPDATDQMPDAFYYQMTGKKVAIIFNHYSFSKKVFRKANDRDGTYEDRDRMKTCLKELGFDSADVTIYEDETKDNIFKICKEARKKDHSKTACLVIVIMTHGKDDGMLLAHDDIYNIDDIVDLFHGENAKNLAGKPKLFIVQACRGDLLDKGTIVLDGHGSSSKDAFPTGNKIPTHADFFVMYSSYPGYASWREADGSWFMQTLCRQLTAKRESFDLLSIATFVVGIVSDQYESKNSQKTKFDKKKATPQITSTLRRLLKFED